MDTFNSPIQPAINSSMDETPRMITNKFGDGYAQDTPDGLNTVVGSMSLSFTGTPANIDIIVNFFRAHVGKPFYYNIPPSTGVRKWIVTSRWSRTYPAITWHTLTVSLEERFTAGA